MNTVDLLWMLRRFRILYLAVFFVTAAGIGYYIIPYVLKYQASSTFYLANESMVNPQMFSQKGQQDLLQVSLVQERVYQLAYSTEMMGFLISTFDLYHHYGIDTTKNDYYAKTVKRITENVNFSKITPDLSSVVVFDRNNEVAASMANSLVWKLDQLNKKYLIDKIQGNLNFYNSYLEEASGISIEQNKKLHEYMDRLQNMRQNSSGKAPLSEVEFSLYEAVSKIEDMTTQLILAKSLYRSALGSQKGNNLPSLVIIKKALPETQSKRKFLLLFAAMGGFIAVASLVILMSIFFTYREELTIVFGFGKQERKVS